MIEFTDYADAGSSADASVTLPIEHRVKSRQRVTLDDGRDAGILLARGGDALRHGDKLRSACGVVVEIVAADESLSVARCVDALEFARAAYHLGNRHVPVQICSNGDEQLLSYLHDHVLDEMLIGLGVSVSHTTALFSPEPGAYGGGHHHHH